MIGGHFDGTEGIGFRSRVAAVFGMGHSGSGLCGEGAGLALDAARAGCLA